MNCELCGGTLAQIDEKGNDVFYKCTTCGGIKNIDKTKVANLTLNNDLENEETQNTAVSVNNFSNNEIDESEKSEENKTMSGKYKVGDTLFFGSFYQEESKAPVEWIVLDIQDNKMLVISKYILYKAPYAKSVTQYVWHNSNVRSWLNTEFYKIAFDKNEKKKILTTFVKNPKNPTTLYGGSRTTLDKLFVLSFDEAYKYFSSNESRKATGTKYAGGTKYYWLRTQHSNTAFLESEAVVWEIGSIESITTVNRNRRIVDGISGIRPAMWIKID